MVRGLLLAGLLVAVAAVVLLSDHDQHTTRATPRSSARRAGPPIPRRVVIGRSRMGRPLVARVLGDPAATRKVLVVGCIHGDESAGIAIVRRLRAAHPPAGTALWLLEDVNPDGVAARTRQNAHGVDLNRNFPYAWRPLGRQGDQQYSGPHPLSEPEARAARAFILRVRPQITVWFHQPLGVVDESGGRLAVERRFAHAARLPLRRLTRYPGSVASWEDHRLPGATAFVVELPRVVHSPGRYARAVLTLLPARPR